MEVVNGLTTQHVKIICSGIKKEKRKYVQNIVKDPIGKSWNRQFVHGGNTIQWSKEESWKKTQKEKD